MANQGHLCLHAASAGLKMAISARKITSMFLKPAVLRLAKVVCKTQMALRGLRKYSSSWVQGDVWAKFMDLITHGFFFS